MHKLYFSSSFSHFIAGLVAVVVGVTSTVALIFQAASAAGATSAEISSWLLVLGIGMGGTCIGLSLYYRMPILTAWSTPGAALLITSLHGIPMAEAIGAFIFSAILIILSGITGFFEKAMICIPRSLTSAMLAGILLHFGTHIFIAMQHQFFLVGAMFVAYLVGKCFFPRAMILLVLSVGIFIAHTKGLFHLEHFQIALASPIFTAPKFSWSTLISIGIPLYIVTMASQNIPGVATIHAAGYRPPLSPIISWTGITNLLLAPFGGFGFSLAAITAAICLNEEAGLDPTQRYKAAVYAGIFYLIVGLFGATFVTLFTALPNELALATAGLALLGTIHTNLQIMLENDTQRESALITFLISASGVSFFGMGAACWGLITGMLSLIFFASHKNIRLKNWIDRLISLKNQSRSY